MSLEGDERPILVYKKVKKASSALWTFWKCVEGRHLKLVLGEAHKFDLTRSLARLCRYFLLCGINGNDNVSPRDCRKES